MYTVAELEVIDLAVLTTAQRIEAAVSIRVYLAEYKLWELQPPAWLVPLQQDIAAVLRVIRREHEVTEVEEARARVRGRLPLGERRALIQREIAALEEEFRQL